MSDVYNSDPHQLASLLDVEAVAGDVSKAWLPEELASILRHQLAVPLAEDLGERVIALDEQLGSSGKYHGLASKTFGELLREPAPPIEALHLLKQFAKDGRAQRGALLPPEVATVLYYASIVLARDRCTARITRLDDSAIAEGRRWIIAQPWVADEIKALVRDGVQHAATSAPTPSRVVAE
jgi:hypothetical protein